MNLNSTSQGVTVGVLGESCVKIRLDSLSLPLLLPSLAATLSFQEGYILLFLHDFLPVSITFILMDGLIILFCIDVSTFLSLFFQSFMFVSPFFSFHICSYRLIDKALDSYFLPSIQVFAARTITLLDCASLIPPCIYHFFSPSITRT